jgi:hypothetical protein
MGLYATILYVQVYLVVVFLSDFPTQPLHTLLFAYMRA